jgi:hypothetical protein
MKRIVGPILSVVGLLCIVAAATVFLAAPRFIRLPSEGTMPTVVLEAPGATLMQEGAQLGQAQPTDLRTTTKTRGDGTTDDGAVIWDVTQETVVVASGTPISATESRIALDPRTGAAVDWSGQCLSTKPAPCQPGNVKYAGQLYQFPFNTEKKTYQFFDLTLKTALPITYRGTELVNGLHTYRFVQTLPDQRTTPDPQMLAALTAALPADLRPAEAAVLVQGSRTAWVEPITGSIVNYREHTRQSIVLPAGLTIPLVDADFQYTAPTRADIAAEASDGIATIRLVRWYLPAGLILVGLVALPRSTTR